jgi:hypothetical protein
MAESWEDRDDLNEPPQQQQQPAQGGYGGGGGGFNTFTPGAPSFVPSYGAQVRDDAMSAQLIYLQVAWKSVAEIPAFYVAKSVALFGRGCHRAGGRGQRCYMLSQPIHPI